MSRFLTAAGPLLGRVLLAALFLWSGWSKLSRPAGAAARLAAQKLPYATAGAIAAGVLEVAAGALLVLGWKVRSGALALLGYLAVVTWLFHWSPAMAGDGAQLVQVLKNAAVGGGLLLVASHGAGPASLDRG